jgi:hypothetical protein
VVVSLGGGHLLGVGLFTARVFDPLEVLALELGELDGVGDVEVEDGPDEREAARFAGEPADHLVRGLALPSDLSNGLLERHRRRCLVG